MNQAELDFFLDLVPYYEIYLKKNPDSLIARIYGVYTIRMKGKSKVNLMLMANTLNFRGSGQIKHIFDLKGSTIDREVKAFGDV